MIMKHFDRAAKWYFPKAAMPYWSVLVFDCVILLLADFLCISIISGPHYVLNHLFKIAWSCLFYLIFYIIGFRLLRTYSGVLRFSSFIDLKQIGSAMLFGLVCSICFQLVFSPSWLFHIRFVTMVTSMAIATVIMWFTRIWMKGVYDNWIQQKRCDKCLIYGVKEGGIALAKNINAQEDCPFQVKGFVADTSDMVGKTLLGKPVMPNDDSLINVMKKNGITVLVVSPLKMDQFRSDDRMVNSLIENNIKIMMVPEPREWDGKSDIKSNEMKEVNVEDLLPRNRIEVSMAEIGKMLNGKKILITGAAGSIGSEIVRQTAPYAPAELILIDQAETPLHDIRLMMAHNWSDIDAPTIVVDIADSKKMEEIFKKHKPEYVFHAAAYKHVPMMEDNPYESIENNVNGTRIVADLSVKYGAEKFVMVSTDKAVNPTNVMGCSKRICEIYVQSLDKAIKDGIVHGKTQFVTTRFGNVLGSNGSVIPLFERQIKAGGPITVTHPEIIRFFMLIPEACKLVLEAATMGKGGEIFVFDMGAPVKIADLAKRMIKMSGAKNIEIKYTGLRDGEKLYEEILNDEEVTIPTFHEKINIAKVREYDYTDISRIIAELIDTATYSDDMAIVARMKAIVPEFKSQHSKYEILDKAATISR